MFIIILMKKVFCLLIVLFFIFQPLTGTINDNTEPINANIILTKAVKSLTGCKICVDPGHGGSDPGASGYDGAGYPDEKDFNLNVSLALRDLLEGDGAAVVMTRTEDIDVNLSERCRIANENNTDIFVSIHCNSYTDETVNGTETYYHTSLTANSAAANLSNFIQDELIQHLNRTNRGVKQADYYVLRETNMPATLTELVFISNKIEFELMCKAIFRQDCAYAVYHGICSNFSQTPKDYSPFVEITNPSNNTTVEGVIKITADVTDDFGVGWVRMKINDGSWQWDSTPPHEWVWETRDEENGTYIIMVEANDTINNRINKTVTVTIINQHFTRLFSSGWNFITLPLNTTYEYAGDLANNILNSTHIGKWNTSSQQFEFYVKNTDTNNFTLQQGSGYMVYTNTTSSLMLTGTNITNITINMDAGWNSIGWHNFTKTKAENLGQNITNCTAVAYWNVTLGRFITHPINTDISDFGIERGMGCFVYVTTSSTWTY